MRILLYSDLQLHPYKEFATYETGVNSRLLDHINVLNQIYDYAVENEIEYIVCGGDVFEARAKVDVVAAKLLAEWKWKVAQAGITQIDVIGNHDLCDKSTTNNAIELYRFYPGQKIVAEPQWIQMPVRSQGILCIPYMHRLEDIKAAFKLPAPEGVRPENSIAIVHYGLYDVPTESHSVIRDLGYETEGQVRLSDLEPLLEKVKHVFFGHFHITTSVTQRVHFIGTPLQHKWGESSVKTRFLDIDLGDGGEKTVSFKEVITKAPRFFTFQTLHDVDMINHEIFVKDNFCRVQVDVFEDREPARQKLLGYGARGADAIVVKKSHESASRLGLNLSMSFEEMGAAMVDADTTNLDKTKLKNVLADALKTAAARMNA